MEISRRDFIKLVGGVSGAIAAGSYGLNQIIDIPEKLVEKLKNGHRIESWKSTICGLCPGGCGIRVRLINGVPVGLKGNQYYPINQGGMCPTGHAALQQLYNPDRVKGPLRRIGLQKSGKWETINWDDALNTISNKLIELRKNGKSHQTVFLGYDEHGLMKEHISRFMKAYGSPNYFQTSHTQNNSIPFIFTQGHGLRPTYDILNTKLILSFGANFLEEGFSPIYYTKLFSHFKEAAREREAKFIYIDSRMSLTGANADRWIPIVPGTFGALALGIAFVLIREELYDEEFIKNHSFGFEDWIDYSGNKHLGFKNLVLSDYYPEKVSSITNVPSETILEIARDLGNTRPSLVLGDQGAVNNTNGAYSQMAIHSLNALLGNFEKEGGLYFIDKPSYDKFPPVKEDSIAKSGNQRLPVSKLMDGFSPIFDFSFENFTKNILSDQPYPIEVLFIKGNPLFQSLYQRELAEAIKKIPLVISFDSFINETNEYANYILPDHTFLEKWDESSNIPTVGFNHFGIQQPVVEPLFDTRHMGDVLINIAKRINGTVALSFPFKSYKDGIYHIVENIYKSGEGAIASEGVEGVWLEYLQQRGWQIGRYASLDEFWNLLLEKGGWWNPIKKKKLNSEIFKTPSGKFEFYSQIFKSKLDSLRKNAEKNKSTKEIESLLVKLNFSAKGDTIFLPHHENVLYEDNFPFILITFQLLTNRNGESSNLPLMQEMFGYTMRQYWDSWVEINPVIAAEKGITDGNWVWIESSVGTIKARAKLFPGIIPSAVGIPFGLGHTSYGRYAKGFGVNPTSIIKNHYDLISGLPALHATKVKISLAT